jgi:hypothetical protein
LSPNRPRARRRAPLLPAAAAVLLALLALLPEAPRAAVFPGSVVIRAEGRAPIVDGRVDAAYQQALDEAFRRALLDALRVIAPDRQSPGDLETWQENVLSRAGDFVGAWRVLSEEQKDGFLALEAEVEVWREKLARASRAGAGATATRAVRLLVLAGSFPLADPASDEEVDAGAVAAVALEAEFSRRGAVIVGTTDRAPWESATGPSSEENRVALAAASAKRLDADTVLIAQLSRRGDTLALFAQLVAASSEATLGSARVEFVPAAGEALADAFAPAARKLAGALATHLSAARAAAARGGTP